MYNTQFINLLKSFSAPEINRFEKFLNSPYFNTNNKIAEMFMHLKAVYPEFKGESIIKENIFKKLFNGEKYDDGKMRYYTNELLKLGEDFLAQENLKKDKVIYEVHSLRELIERKQDKLILKKISGAAKALRKEKYPAHQFFYYSFLLKSLKNYFLTLIDIDLDPADVIDEGENTIMLMLEVITETSANLYILETAYNYPVPGNLISSLKESLDIEKVINAADKYNSKYTDEIKMYRERMKLPENPDDEEHYYRLKTLVLEHAENMHKGDLFNIFNSMQSYLSREKQKAKDKFRLERFELNRLSVKLGAHTPSPQNYLTLGAFRDYIITAIFLKQFDAAEEFINTYSHLLDPQTRNDSVNLGSAFIYHAKKEYDKALSSLAKVMPIDIFFKHDIKSLSLRIYYDKDLIEPTLEVADTYLHFVNTNKKIPILRKQAVINFIRVVKDLIQFKLGKGQKTAEDIISDISSSKNIQYRQWLLDKAIEL